LGIGHTITLSVGAAIISLGWVIPARMGLSMELSVGLTLILLGIFNHRRSADDRIVDPQFAACACSHFGRQAGQDRSHRVAGFIDSYGLFQIARPLIVGIVHGLAGSAAVALLVLGTIHNTRWSIC
jgi:high-affinity nickel-transport protein